MRAVKLAILLPLVHVLIFLGFFGPHLFPDREPNSMIQVWFGLNAPVLVLIDAIRWIGPKLELSSRIRGGAGPIYLVFLAGGLAVWFCTGGALDNFLRGQSHRSKDLRAREIVGALFLIGLGIRLAFHGLQWILPVYLLGTHSVVSILNTFLILIWSAVLVALPSRKFLDKLRQRPPNGTYPEGV